MLKIKRLFELVQFFFTSIKAKGLATTLSRMNRFFRRKLKSKKGRFLPSYETLQEQRQSGINYGVISLCVPLYNTKIEFLEQLVENLLLQSYSHFELCFADASDEVHGYVGEYIIEQNDARIKYKKVQNLGISANTNEAAMLASGEYIAFADHDDILSPDAFYEVITAFERTKADFIYTDEALFETDYKDIKAPHLKPDYSPFYLQSCNYICHLAAVRKTLFFQLSGFEPQYDGAQDHDLFLRISQKTDKIYHLPKVLYYWRAHSGSTAGGVAAKPYVENAAKMAISAHLERLNIKAQVKSGIFPSTYKVDYAILKNPMVSVIIPNYEHKDELSTCINSIYKKNIYRNFEIIIVENNSKSDEIFEYYEQLQNTYKNLRVVKYEGEFNYPKINNFGVSKAIGEYILLLNNDVEVINAEFMSELLQLAQLENVGAVGAMLYYKNDKIQHAGVITGLGGYAGHSHKYHSRGASGYMFRLAVVNEFSAVTAACLMVKKSLYKQLKGLDERFAVAFNDVDFCLRLRARGLYNLFTPYSQLYHHESISRGADSSGVAKTRFKEEQQLLYARYGEALKRDPFYNINLTLDMEDFSEQS